MVDVLYVSSVLGGLVGGDIAPLTNLACLAGTGLDILVCAGGGAGQLKKWPETACLPRLDIPQYPLYDLWLDRLFLQRCCKWLSSELKECARRRRLKKVSARFLFSATPDDHLIQDHGLRGRESVLMNHGSPLCYTDLIRFPWPGLDLVRKTMSRYDHLLFLTESVCEAWRSFPEVAGKETHVVPEAIDEVAAISLLASPKAKMRERLQLPKDKFVVVCVASLQQRKGQDFLVKHACAIKGHVPDISMYFVGISAEAWARETVLPAIRSDRTGVLNWVGPRHDALCYIYAADAVILPSYAEAFGMPLIEGMVLRTPVIAAGVDGMKDVLQNGKFGWMFCHEQPESLISALEDVYHRRGVEEKVCLSEKHYWEQYSWSAQRARMKDMFSPR